MMRLPYMKIYHKKSALASRCVAAWYNKLTNRNLEDVNEHMKFLGMEQRKALHLKGEIDPAMYDEVFNAEIKESDPEDIFRRFNSERQRQCRWQADN